MLDAPPWHAGCEGWHVTAVDYLLNARANLDALAELLADAAEEGKAASEIVDQALVIVNDVRNVLDTLGDEEGTQ